MKVKANGIAFNYEISGPESAPMQDELPDSKYVVLPGAGHIFNMDQPEMFTRSPRDFLRPN